MKKEKRKKQKDQENAESTVQNTVGSSSSEALAKEDRQDAVDHQVCEKCEEYLAGWKRALADYENLRGDIDRTKSENRHHIRIDLALDLLPVIDNFEQAVNHVPNLSSCDDVTKKSIENWLQGVTFIKKQFEDVLANLGIEPIDVGGSFDHNLHEAIEEREEEGRESGAILDVRTTGWKMGDRVLRPAKVIIKKIN